MTYDRSIDSKSLLHLDRCVTSCGPTLSKNTEKKIPLLKSFRKIKSEDVATSTVSQLFAIFSKPTHFCLSFARMKRRMLDIK